MLLVSCWNINCLLLQNFIKICFEEIMYIQSRLVFIVKKTSSQRSALENTWLSDDMFKHCRRYWKEKDAKKMNIRRYTLVVDQSLLILNMYLQGGQSSLMMVARNEIYVTIFMAWVHTNLFQFLFKSFKFLLSFFILVISLSFFVLHAYFQSSYLWLIMKTYNIYTYVLMKIRTK